MANVKFTYANAMVSDAEIQMMKTQVEAAKDVLLAKTGAGNDFLG